MEFSQETQVLVKIENCLIISFSYVIIIIQLSYCCYSIKTSFYENDSTILHIPWSNKTSVLTSTETHDYTN